MKKIVALALALAMALSLCACGKQNGGMSAETGALLKPKTGIERFFEKIGSLFD